jgi:hypothetical protein
VKQLVKYPSEEWMGPINRVFDLERYDVYIVRFTKMNLNCRGATSQLKSNVFEMKGSPNRKWQQ